jgi:AraC family transcriptional regulator
MTTPGSRSEYDQRMHRVLAHIDAHLDQTLGLATLADVAHFSPFHFHRLFTAWMGHTLGDYLRRRRVEVADRPAVPVAYLRHVGPYGDAVGLFWQKAFHPWRHQHGLQNQPCYGVGHDDPLITDPAQCRYDACTEYPADFVPPRHMLTTTLPGGRHAVMPFEGTAHTIGEAWQYLLRHWLPHSGYQIANAPCLEHYTAASTYNAETGVFTCDLCIPLVPL